MKSSTPRSLNRSITGSGQDAPPLPQIFTREKSASCQRGCPLHHDVHGRAPRPAVDTVAVPDQVERSDPDRRCGRRSTCRRRRPSGAVNTLNPPVWNSGIWRIATSSPSRAPADHRVDRVGRDRPVRQDRALGQARGAARVADRPRRRSSPGSASGRASPSAHSSRSMNFASESPSEARRGPRSG